MHPIYVNHHQTMEVFQNQIKHNYLNASAIFSAVIKKYLQLMVLMTDLCHLSA